MAKKEEDKKKRSILYGDSRSQVTNKTVQKAIENEDSVKRQSSINKGLSKSGNPHQASADAYLKDHARRQRGFTGKKEDMPFQQSQPRIQYSDAKFKSKDRPSLGSAMKWKSEIGNSISKSYGKTQNIRIKEFLKQQYGMNDGGAEDFMKYMDAKEKEATSKEGREILSDTTWKRGAQEHQTNSLLLNIEDAKRHQERRQKEIEAMTPDEKEQDGDRGFLDRTFDALMIGQYASANTAKAMLDGKGGYKVTTAIKDGLRAGTPWGDGYEQGEGNYSSVLRSIEKKYGNEVTNTIKDTFVGRAGIGTAGFVLDVLLDPLSYATMGASAIIKGGVKGARVVGEGLSKSISKEFGVDVIKSSADIPKISDDLYQRVLDRTANEMPNASPSVIQKSAEATHESMIHGLKAGFDGLDIDTAKQIVTKKNAPTGFAKSTDDVTREAQELTRKYNELMGRSRQGKIGLSLGNMPFAEKLVGQKLASKTLGFSDSTVRAISDKLRISKPYQQLRKSIYTSKAMAHLSPNSVMYKLAKESPDKLYDVINATYVQRGLKGSMFDQQKVYAKITEKLNTLTPSQQKEVMDILQNPAMVNPIVKQIELVATEEAKHFRTALEQTQAEEIVKLEDLKQFKTQIDELRKYQENDVFNIKTELDALEKDFLSQIDELDLELLRGTRAYEEVLSTLEESRKAIDDTYLNASSDVLKGLEPLPDLPEPPKKPTLRGKPREPKLQDIPDAPTLEKPLSREEFVSDVGTEQEYIVNKFLDVTEALKTGSSNFLDTRYQFVKTFNAYLKQGNNELDDFVAKVTPNYELARLVKMVEDGYDTDQIINYINTNKYRYDGRGTEIYGILAEEIGYGSGTKYKNWQAFYDDRINPLKEKTLRGETLTDAEQRLQGMLEKASLKRAELFNTLKHKSMKGILNYKKEKLDADINNLERSNNAHLKELAELKRVEGTQDNFEIPRFSRDNGAYDFAPPKEAEYTIYKLDDTESLEVQAVMQNVLKNVKEIKNPSSYSAIASDVVEVVPKVIQQTFKRQWMDLSRDQRNYVVTRATKIVASNEGDIVQKSFENERKIIAQRIQERLQKRHIQAINDKAKVGDTIIFKDNPMPAKIVSRESYNDGTTYFMAQLDEGIVNVPIGDVMKLNSAKPSELVFEQLVMDDIQAGYKGHLRDVEIRNNARLQEWNKEVEKVFQDNQVLKDTYDKRVEQWIAKREEQYKVELDEFNKRYPEVLAERERIEAQNRATLEQIELAQKESSKLADEYFNEVNTVKDMLSASKDLSQENTLRKIAIEQLQRVYNENQSTLLKKLNDAELKLGVYGKHIGTEGGHPELVRIADEQIAKVEEEIAKLKEITPIDMSDLIVKESEIDVKIAELRKGLDTTKYSDEELYKRFNSALPIDPVDNLLHGTNRTFLPKEKDEFAKLVENSAKEIEEAKKISTDNKAKHQAKLDYFKSEQYEKDVPSLDKRASETQRYGYEMDNVDFDAVVKKAKAKDVNIRLAFEKYSKQYNSSKGRNARTFRKEEKSVDTLVKEEKNRIAQQEKQITDQIKTLEEQKKAIWQGMSDAEKKFSSIESWNAEMSRLILAKNQMLEDRKIVDGTLNIDDVVKELEQSVEEIDKILGNDALFEGYLRKNVAPEQIANWYKLNDYTIIQDKQLMDVGKYDNEVVKTARMLRRELVKMGQKEINLGKLDKVAFEKMTDGYLPHILTPNGMRLLESRKGKEELKNGGLPFGFYNAKNPHAMSRTIKELTFKDGTKAINPTIDQINRYFKEKFGTEEFFNTNLPEIFMSRAMKHTELVYSGEYMENTMKLFGTNVTKQTFNPKKKYYVNVGKLRTYVNQGVADRVKDMGQRGFVGNLTPDDFAKIQDELLQNMGITRSVLEDDFVPMLQLNNKSIQHLLDAGQDWIYDVPNHVVMKMNQARMVSIERDHNQMLQIYDKFLHWTKLMQTVVSPSFHMRNAYANMFNNWLSVGANINNPRYMIDMFNMVKKQGKDTGLPNFKFRDVNGNWSEMSPEEMYETAKKYGAIDEGVFAQEFGSTASRIKMKGNGKQKEGTAFQRYTPISIKHSLWFKAGTTVGTFTDNHARLSQFIAHVQDGKSFEEAKAMIDKYLFDYSDLTLFEQRVMKRIIPYYTFWRKNTSLQLKSIDEKSHKMRLTAKAMNIGDGTLNEDEKVERKYVSDFAKSWVQLPFWGSGKNAFTGEEGKKPILLNPALPFMDLDRIPDFSTPSEGFMSVASQTAPMIKLPLELGANKSMFFGNQISEKVKEGEGADATYSYDVSKMAVDYAKYLTMQTAPIVQLEGLVSKEGGDWTRHALSTAFGVKTLAYDVGTSKSIAMNKERYESGYMNDYEKASYEKYMEQRSVPLDKLFESSDKYLSLSKGNAKLKEKYYKEANKVAIALDNWTKGEEYDEKYKPFIDVMSKFSGDENKARDFVGATLDKTSLDGLLLGKDFTTLDVEDVLDGDTFTVDYKGKKRSVRLLLVDTPETGKEILQPDMAYGQEAFKFTSDMIKGKNVQMVIDNRGTDAYGRLLAYVYVDGRLLQSQIVNEGLGSVAYTDMDDSDRNNYRQSLLEKLQEEAKKKKKGVHSIEGYVGNDGSYNNESYMTEEELKLLYGN